MWVCWFWFSRCFTELVFLQKIGFDKHIQMLEHTVIQLILNTFFINKITRHLGKWDLVAFSLLFLVMLGLRCCTPISGTASEVFSDGSSTATSFVYLCVVVSRLMQKETKIQNSIVCGTFTHSTKGSYGSEMPQQIYKHSIMCLILSKIVISSKYITWQSKGRITKEVFGDAYEILVGTDPRMLKLRMILEGQTS